MRIGVNYQLKYSTPEDWIACLRSLGVCAAVSPVQPGADTDTVAASIIGRQRKRYTDRGSGHPWYTCLGSALKLDHEVTLFLEHMPELSQYITGLSNIRKKAVEAGVTLM